MEQFSTFLVQGDQTIEVVLNYAPGDKLRHDCPGFDSLVDVVEAIEVSTGDPIELSDDEIEKLERDADRLYAEYKCEQETYDDPHMFI